MIRLLLAAVALIAASPAAAQALTPTIGGCSAGIASNRVSTSTDTLNLRRRADCYNTAARWAVDERDRTEARIKVIASTPQPSPTPTSAPTAPKLAGLVVEGDSLTGPEWGGNYPGIYRKLRPGVQMTVLAKGGARINDTGGGNGLVQRLPALIAAKPSAVTVLIGANDLGDGQYATPEAWLAALWGYVGQVKATGAKVAVGTVLPICVTSNASYTARHLQRRAVVNAAIRAAVGSKIDAVIDYAADDKIGPDAAACSRTWYKDEIHTSDGDAAGNGGEGRMALLFAPVADKLLSGAAITPAPDSGNGDATPPPTGGNVTVGLTSIPSNFTVASYIEPSNNYVGGNVGAIAPSASPDVVGAFRFDCKPGPIKFDDPIVFPGQPGNSHLHQFFGNTAVDANSTYESLRTTGESTCNNKLNRSPYWIPAMLNGKGGVVRPDFASIYYKRLPQTSAECRVQAAQGCVELPRGLRFIYGYDMRTMTAPATFEEGRGYFNCQGPGSTPGHYSDIVEVAKFCPVGAQLGIVLIAPQCWDGKNLDSADHRSHMGYALYSNGQDGHPHCDAAHPYLIPGFQLGAWYTVDADLDRSGTWEPGRATWSLSSDDMTAMGMGQQRPGSTVHGDWWGAWDDSVMKMWTDNCINKKLNCSGGDLGNGTAIKNIPVPEFASLPRVVPIPARPGV